MKRRGPDPEENHLMKIIVAHAVHDGVPLNQAAADSLLDAAPI